MIKAADRGTTAEVQALFHKAKVLNGERVRCETSGGDYRLSEAWPTLKRPAGRTPRG